MIINGRQINHRNQPYIVAEISCNHNGKFDMARSLVREAYEAGADAVKFQAYTADTITMNHCSDDFIVQDGPWKGNSLHRLYEKTHTPFEWFPSLFDSARTLGITPFASVFDKSSVDMLEKLNCQAYKIASFEITDIPLIQYAAKTGKPIIVSTGMASEDEIDAAMEAAGDNSVALACVSGYPTNIADADLHKIGHSRFVQGISDHTRGSAIPVAATALGATIIEKHLMLGHTYTEDFEFSMKPREFASMVYDVREVWKAIHWPKKSNVEQSSRQMRRSLYVVQDIKAGEKFTEANVRSIRPAYGMEPSKLSWVLSQVAAADLKRGTALKSKHIRGTP